MRSSFDTRRPDQQRQSLVDKRVGDAFQTVQYVASNMSKLLELAPGSTRTVTVESATWLKGQVVTIPLPAGVTMPMVRGSTVTVVDNAGQVWGDHAHWTTVLSNGELKFTLGDSAPVNMQNAPIYWTISYEVT